MERHPAAPLALLAGAEAAKVLGSLRDHGCEELPRERHMSAWDAMLITKHVIYFELNALLATTADVDLKENLSKARAYQHTRVSKVVLQKSQLP